VPTVERRLSLAYGGAAAMRIAGQGARTRVEVDLPSEGPLSGVNV
jgi:hypothetical protein